MKKWQDIVFMQGTEAEEASKILIQQGEKACLEYLKQWDYGEGGRVFCTIPWGDMDKIYTNEQYTLYHNNISYIGLLKDVSNEEVIIENEYGFKITKDIIDKGKLNGKIYGNFNENKQCTKFRLLDDDKNVYFEGIMNGINGYENEAFYPLDTLGASYGCIELQYKHNIKWETL